jgi:hypothetical protein
MKKLVTVFLFFTLIFGLAGCKRDDSETNDQISSIELTSQMKDILNNHTIVEIFHVFDDLYFLYSDSIESPDEWYLTAYNEDAGIRYTKTYETRFVTVIEWGENVLTIYQNYLSSSTEYIVSRKDGTLIAQATNLAPIVQYERIYSQNILVEDPMDGSYYGITISAGNGANITSINQYEGTTSSTIYSVETTQHVEVYQLSDGSFLMSYQSITDYRYYLEHIQKDGSVDFSITTSNPYEIDVYEDGYILHLDGTVANYSMTDNLLWEKDYFAKYNGLYAAYDDVVVIDEKGSLYTINASGTVLDVTPLEEPDGILSEMFDNGLNLYVDQYKSSVSGWNETEQVWEHEFDEIIYINHYSEGVYLGVLEGKQFQIKHINSDGVVQQTIDIPSRALFIADDHYMIIKNDEVHWISFDNELDWKSEDILYDNHYPYVLDYVPNKLFVIKSTGSVIDWNKPTIIQNPITAFLSSDGSTIRIFDDQDIFHQYITATNNQIYIYQASESLGSTKKILILDYDGETKEEHEILFYRNLTYYYIDDDSLIFVRR